MTVLNGIEIDAIDYDITPTKKKNETNFLYIILLNILQRTLMVFLFPLKHVQLKSQRRFANIFTLEMKTNN